MEEEKRVHDFNARTALSLLLCGSCLHHRPSCRRVEKTCVFAGTFVHCTTPGPLAHDRYFIH